MTEKKSCYLVKDDPKELIFDNPKYYMDSYRIRSIFTKDRSKLFELTWNAISWLTHKHPNGVFANMMYLSYLMGVYDEGWERDVIASGDPKNWE